MNNDIVDKWDFVFLLFFQVVAKTVQLMRDTIACQ
jgi:hypothetical protein